MRVLFIFPNIDCGGYKPVGLTAVMNSCRASGHDVQLFDTSFFDTKDIHGNDRYMGTSDAGEEILNYRHVDTKDYGLIKEDKNIKQELISVLQKFRPDVVGISVLSVEWRLSVALLDIVKEFNPEILTVVGGIHTFADPEGTVGEKSVDIICIGEGELAFVELLNRIDNNKDFEKTDGFWVKKNGVLHKNITGQVVFDLNALPFLDYDFYDDRLMYRIYDGKVYRSGDGVVTRGCPGKCSYCLYQTMSLFNKDNSKLRRYDVDRLIDELVHLKKRYSLNFFRFQDATFLSLSSQYLKELSVRYAKEVALPFVVDVSPQSVTHEKARALADMGCVSVSVGVETGNEKMRFEMCNKPVRNSTILKAFEILNAHGLRTVSFLLMGFPNETREMYWDTVRLVKEARVQSPALGFVYPFKGSSLRKLSVKLGLFDEAAEQSNQVGYSRGWPAINNPNISPQEYRGMLRSFMLYVKFPERYWNEIKKAEDLTEEGNRVYGKFARIYKEENLYNTFLPEDKNILV
ncbi:MAG: B12-binding domain-containing radical SAM protein [Nitrospirae bacterium]|nr:B12-binding domain-containing radical SAM protein [Nitrospirota bacterium]